MQLATITGDLGAIGDDEVEDGDDEENDDDDKLLAMSPLKCRKVAPCGELASPETRPTSVGICPLCVDDLIRIEPRPLHTYR